METPVSFPFTIYPQCPYCGKVNHASNNDEVRSGAIGFCDTCGELTLILENSNYFLCHKMTQEMIDLFKRDFPDQYDRWRVAYEKIRSSNQAN